MDKQAIRNIFFIVIRFLKYNLIGESGIFNI
jgi:hypothetical protein